MTLLHFKKGKVTENNLFFFHKVKKNEQKDQYCFSESGIFF